MNRFERFLAERRLLSKKKCNFAAKLSNLTNNMKTKSTKRQQGFRDALQRLTMTLMFVMLTAMTAWAGQKPVSCLEACTGGMELIHIQGWAYDPDAPAKSLTLELYIYADADCQQLVAYTQNLTADVSRPDVNEAKGITGNHGFYADIPMGTAGNYWVKLIAIDTNGDGDTQIGSTTKVTVTAEPEPVTITIGDGQYLSCGQPFIMDENYSLVQQIYTAEEINMEGTITSISFSYYSPMPFSMSGVQVYLKHTDKNRFDSQTDMVPVGAEDKVFEGTFSATGAGWVTITLDTPFEYDGINNLLVCTLDPTDGSFGTSPPFFYYHHTSDKKSHYAYSDNTVPSLMESNVIHSYSYIWRNNIRFNIIPGTFSKPDNLTVSSCTEEEATLTWTTPETVHPIMGYGYQFKKASDADWSEEVITTGTSATFSNLTADTDYNFRVRTIYGSRNSPYQPLNFTTATPLPYEMGLEDGYGRWTMVDCETYFTEIYHASGTGRRTQAAHDSNVGFQFGCYGEGNKIPQYLISPRFSGDAAITLSFYYRVPTNIAETIYVGYSTTTNDKDAFTFGDAITFKSNDWTKYEHTFPANARYFAVKYTSNEYFAYIDDFSFEESSPYAKPTTVGYTTVSETEATMAWNTPTGATGFAYKYKKMSDAAWSAEATVNTNTVTLSGLTPNTYYNFRVKALYGSNASTYATYTFQTDANVVDLPYSDGFENGMGGWRMINCNGTTEIVKADNPHSGTYSFWFMISDHHQYLLSPHFAGGVPMKVSFYYKNYENKSATFVVGYTSSKDAEITWLDNAVTTNSGAWTLYETTVPAEAQYVVICCRKEGKILYLDDFSFLPMTSVTFAKEGYGTYYNSLMDAVLPAGMKARIVTAKGDGNALTYETIADGDQIAATSAIVPKATAVMLQTAASTTTQSKDISLASPTDTRDFSTTNYLHGSDVAKTTDGGGDGAKYYKLSYNTSGEDIGWYWGADEGAAFYSAANKAWLALPASAGAREFFGLPDFEENTTSLREISNEELGIRNYDYYTLDGRKLNGKPTQKGLYIVNGRKFVIK